MTTHQCPLCGAPMAASVQPALMPGRADSVLLRCTRYACDLTLMEADLPAFLTAADVSGYARAAAREQAVRA